MSPRTNIYGNISHNGMFCPCCGMTPGHSVTGRRAKEKLRRKNQQLRLISQDLMNGEATK